MRQRYQPVCISLALAIGIWALFYPVIGHDFVNLDDPEYVTDNLHLSGGLTRANVAWAFSAWRAGNWHPLTWLSHMLDVQWFGPGPAGPHLVNLGLHTGSTLLLFLVLRRLSGATWRPALVAALFGWHPLHVESVAWIAERKDVLSGFFFLITLWAYTRFAQKAGSSKTALRWYLLALFFFALGLMSKPMLVTLPFVLLLVDFWPLGRLRATAQSTGQTFRRLLGEKIPFLLMTLGACAATLWAQKKRGAVQSLTDWPLEARIENALVSYIRYLAKAFWPFDLATPYADAGRWPPAVYGSAAVLLLLATLAAWRLRRKHPYLVTGWLWFVGMLVPVIGLVQVGAQAMADRYSYLPLIGVFLIVAWGGAEILTRWRLPSAVSATVAGLVLLSCAARTRDQLHYWKNSETLLRHAVVTSRGNWIAHYNLGWELQHQGRPVEALEHFRQATEIQPQDVDSVANLAGVLVQLKQYAEAVPYFERALRLKPGWIELRYRLAGALLRSERYEEAIGHYRAFLEQQPGHTVARRELGVALGVQGDLAQAIVEFQTVLQAQPEDAEAQFNLGEALAQQGRLAEARRHLAEALRLRPGWAEAQSRLQAIDKSPDKP